MQPGPPRRRRARPVADAPCARLLARAEDLARGWLLALLEDAPLARAGSIPVADMARDGPTICQAIVRALADEGDLRRLLAGGALGELIARTGELCGAEGIEATSRAVDALHAVLWSGLWQELSDPDARQVADLSERLTRVMELVRRSALRRAGQEESGRAGQSGSAARAPARAAESTSGGLWLETLEAETTSAASRGASLALLLAELDDADRVRAVELSGEARITFGRFAQAVRSAVRGQDVMAGETDARAWVIARDTGRSGAQALGARIASAVSQAEPWRGAPLRVSVGVAVLGEDAADAPGLIESAEQAAIAAAAGGGPQGLSGSR